MKSLATAYIVILALCLIAVIATPDDRSCWGIWDTYWNEDIISYLLCRYGSWVSSGTGGAMFAGAVGLAAAFTIYRAFLKS